MAQPILMKSVACIRSDFPTKFGIPRQSGVVDALRATVVFDPEFRNPDALRGLEGFSHIWLIWQFHKAVREEWSPTVRPPRLGGNARMGVFATRSPFRPNAIGLSSVRLLAVEQHPDLGPILQISGADLMDGTPILDIKPYLPYGDCHVEATGGFAPDPGETLAVKDPNGLLNDLPKELSEGLFGVLSHDPRPSYHQDPDRVYGLDFGGFNVKFSVWEKDLTLRALRRL